MKRFGILVAGLCIATSSLAGCASSDPSDDGADEPIAEAASRVSATPPAQIPLPDGGIKLTSGRCNGDGLVIEDGRVYRLGHDIGPDVTGISVRGRTSMGQSVCHNVNTWTPLVEYVCNVNTAEGNTVDATVGTYSGNVSGTSEWINFVQTQYPAETVSDALYFGYSTFPSRSNVDVFPGGDPCPKSAAADIPLLRIECCATAPTP